MPTPTSLLIVSGAAQSAVPEEVFAAPVVVRAFDELGDPLPGESVTFDTPVTDPTGTFDPSGLKSGLNTLEVLTDASGFASSGDILAGSTLGAWRGTVKFTAAPLVIRGFILTNALTPLTPVSLAITAGANQKQAQSTAYGALSVLVKDSGGAPLSGITVRFSVPAGHGTFAGSELTADVVTVGGIATAPTFTADTTLGAFAVTLSIPATPSVDPITTTWTTVNAAVATVLQAISGGGQQAAISVAFVAPLLVRVVNALGNPVAGATVTFTAPGAGASCTIGGSATQNKVSGVSGYAQSSIPVANATAGSYFVVATLAGAASAQFALTNGAGFLPEACTTLAAPDGAVNVGANPTSWVNPNRAINGSSSGAVVTITSPATIAKILLCSPINAAALSAINDDAVITKFDVTYDVRSTRTGTSFPSAKLNIYDGTTGRSGIINGGPGIEAVWSSQTKTFTLFTSPPITGAQLKAGNFGVGFTTTNGATQAGTCAIRNVLLSVCYENPDSALNVIDVPLQFCEA